MRGSRVLFWLLELIVYGALVAAYTALALHALGPWLARVAHDHRTLYAIAAVGLIVGQAVLLDLATRLIARTLHRAVDPE